jgi:hypothetical protein
VAAAKHRPRLRPQKKSQPERRDLSSNIFRKPKWHSIKTHF